MGIAKDGHAGPTSYLSAIDAYLRFLALTGSAFAAIASPPMIVFLFGDG